MSGSWWKIVGKSWTFALELVFETNQNLQEKLNIAIKILAEGLRKKERQTERKIDRKEERKWKDFVFG